MARKYTNTKQKTAFYERYIKKQGGRCAICGDQIELVVDHNHTTGLMRGLLCRPHNQGLGFFNDSPELLELAANYLRKSNNISLRAMKISLISRGLLEKSTRSQPKRKKNEIEDQLIAEIVADLRYPSDRARARALAELLETGVPRLQTKISRYRKMLKKRECN